jgi:hypothetical protein
MTLDDLSQMRSKRREVAWISKRITALSNLQHITSDTVQSAAEFPYSKHSIKITGTDIAELNRIQTKVRKLRARQKKLEAELDEYDDLVESLPDSELRQIIELKFIRGMTWNMVATRVYGYPGGNRARMKTKRFFENF